MSEFSAEDRDSTLFDVIEDFSFADGDRIDLSGIDANSARKGDNAFVLAPDSGFTGRRGELLVFEKEGGGVAVIGDLNGDRAGDFAFEVAGITGLVASDFLL